MWIHFISGGWVHIFEVVTCCVCKKLKICLWMVELKEYELICDE